MKPMLEYLTNEAFYVFVNSDRENILADVSERNLCFRLGERLRLLQHRAGRRFLPVRRVAVLAQHAPHQPPEVGAHVLANVQSMVTLFRTVSTSSRAMPRRVSSPSTRTALSLTPSVS